jgi:MFS family permease
MPQGWSGRAVYTLGFLTLISAFNYLDRSVLGLALPLIKSQMQVSDTVLGLVVGLSFALFYSLFGIPIAWLADRWNRRNIIAIGFAFWSLMTVVTGFVTTVVQLAAARFLMGAGEACGIAPSNSMLADLFGPVRRPVALAIFGTAYSVALLVFYPILGWVGQHHGWRIMFIAAGAPGLLLSMIFFLTVREPPRGSLRPNAKDSCGGTDVAGPREPQDLWTTLRFLAGSRTYWLLLLGVTFMGADIYAAGTWNPTFLRRVHQLSLMQIASSIGPILGLLGASGILLGGILASHLGQRDPRWRLRVPAIACVLVGPAELLFLLSDGMPLWVAGFAFTSFLTLMHQGPIYAVAMSVATPRMRAVATSLILLCASLLGQIFGPLLVGFMSDRLEPMAGELSIRYAMLTTAACAVAAGVSFWAAVRYMEQDMRRASSPAERTTADSSDALSE